MSDEFIKHKENEEVAEEATEIENSKEILEENKNLNVNGDIPIENSDDDINQQLTNMENQYKRLLADYQNLQKRTAQEKEDIYKYASEKTLESLLPALDTMDYARATLNPETTVEKMIKDFNLLLDMFIKCLKDTGIETIEETGVEFDPVFHEPLEQIPTNELPPHTVMKIIKKGYKLNSKVIRPAMVAVSIEEASSES